MISFKQFLSEQGSDLMTFEDAVALVKRKCKPFLNEAKGKPFYRGIQIGTPKDDKTSSFNAHPTSRPAKDSGLAFNFGMNAMFELAYGVKDIRKKTIFGYGDYHDAMAYGKVHFCFPVGKFSYAWSPEIFDSYGDFDDIFHKIADAIEWKLVHRGVTSYKGNWTHDDIRRIFVRLDRILNQDAHGWTKRTKENAVLTRKAIIDTIQQQVPQDPDNPSNNDRGDKVYIREHEVPEDIHEVMLDAMVKATEDLYKNSTELSKALSSHSEIMIYESSGYYLIPVVSVTDAARKEGYYAAQGIHDNSLSAYKYLLEKLS